MHLDRGAVQADGFDLDADDLSMLQLRKYPIQHPVVLVAPCMFTANYSTAET